MIKTLIIDSEQETRELLGNLIMNYCPQAQVVGKAKSISEGKQCMNHEVPDLVILDITFYDQECSDFVDQIHYMGSDIVFVTYFERQAMKAISAYRAAEYLMKPIGLNELTAIIKKLSDRIGESRVNMKRGIIPLPDREGILYANLNDIIRFEGSGAYTEVYFQDGNTLLASKHLKYFEDLITSYKAHQYLRIHQSHLINLLYVKKYFKGDGGYVIMKDGSQVLLSKKHRQKFITKMMNI
jgi:two-component system LytT family response regulator